MSLETEQISRRLRDHELFGVFDDAERIRLIEKAHRHIYSDGETIFQRGDGGSFLFFVIAGRVRISLCTEDGKEILITMIEPGEIMGEMALLDGHDRSSDAQAEGLCEVLVIGREDFTAALLTKPALMMQLIKILCTRLRRTNTLLEMIALQNLPVRLARYVLELGEKHGKQIAEGLRIRSGLHQADIGHHLALSRESVNKQLKAWQEKGILFLPQGGDIVVRDIEKLRRIAFKNAE